jgi:hypothetical protein
VEFLSTLNQSRIGSKKLKELMSKGTVAPRTWAKVIQRISAQCTVSKEKHMREGIVEWRLQGQSLVKQTPELLGFSVENG